MSVLNNMLSLVLVFAIMSIVIFINHEMNNAHPNKAVPDWVFKISKPNPFKNLDFSKETDKELLHPPGVKAPPPSVASSTTHKEIDSHKEEHKVNQKVSIDDSKNVAFVDSKKSQTSSKDDDDIYFKGDQSEIKGSLVCGGKPVDSEIIFWKKVKGDRHYESPITPHHELVLLLFLSCT